MHDCSFPPNLRYRFQALWLLIFAGSSCWRRVAGVAGLSSPGWPRRLHSSVPPSFACPIFPSVNCFGDWGALVRT